MKPAQVSTPSETEVQVQRSFDASADLVWRAYTEPDLVRRWMLGPPGWSMPVCEMDVRAGGKYRWRWRSDEDGKEFGFTGEFLKVVLQAEMVHTQIYDPGDLADSMGDEGAVVTVTFKEHNGVTLATTTIRFATQADRDAALSTGMTDGMEMSYQLLDAVLRIDRTTVALTRATMISCPVGWGASPSNSFCGHDHESPQTVRAGTCAPAYLGSQSVESRPLHFSTLNSRVRAS